MFKKMYTALMAMCLTLFGTISAWATPPALTLPTEVDLSALYPYAALIVGALVGLIVIRKAIKLTNRS